MEVQMQDNIQMTQGINQFIDDARMDIDLPEPLNIKSERIAIVEPAKYVLLFETSLPLSNMLLEQRDSTRYIEVLKICRSGCRNLGRALCNAHLRIFEKN
jgi:hypothetical protein